MVVSISCFLCCFHTTENRRLLALHMHVVVNGGGLAGALSAIYFLQFTKHVTVVEKRGDLRKATWETGRSINLIVTSRGLYALRQVGLEDAALKLCVPVQGRSLHQPDGKEVFQPYGVSPKEVNYSVSRTQLNAMLIDEAERRGARFFFEHELQSIDLDAMRATYKCQSGTLSMKADAFFGADGVGSPTRQIMLKKLQAEGVEASEFMERLGISYKEITFQSVVNPVTGKKDYCMDSKGLHIWPRGAHFLMALADKNETFTGTLYLPDGSAKLPVDASAVPTFESLGKDPTKNAQLIAQYYPDVSSIVPDVVQQMTGRDHSFLATLRVTHWHYRGKVCLFGDAGHGVVPFFGQGMNCAFESVTVLYRFLCQYGLTKDSLETVFRCYQDYHKRSAVAIADMAIENFAEMSYKVSLPEFLKRKQIENAIEAKYPNLLRSRYWMVTKSLIPYAVVKAAGPYVEECVTQLLDLCQTKQCTVDALTEGDVTGIIRRVLTPFLAKNGVRMGDSDTEYYPSKTRAKI